MKLSIFFPLLLPHYYLWEHLFQDLDYGASMKAFCITNPVCICV